jgi:hypothetical protein
MGLFSCFLPIALQIALKRKVSKWIRKPKKRALLVTVFRTIMDTHRQKSCSMGKMFEFHNLASKSNLEPGDFMKLQEYLQEISNMESHDNSFLPMRWFLGRHRPIIGGTRGNYWNRAKMENFLLHVNGWNGTAKGASSFQNIPFPLTSDDIRQEGHNGGGIREVEIYQTAANGGQLPVTPTSSSGARSIALTTPRSQWKEAAALSVGSTPLNTHRGGHGSLASSSSSVGATPLNTHRGHGSLASSCESVGSAPLNSPRGHLCTAPPLQISLIIKWFMATKDQSFNAAMKEVCKGLTYQNDCLMQIFKVVQYFQTLFHDQVLNSLVTQMLFLEKLSNCALIQRTLQASHLFRSIEHVAFADEPIQSMFLEGLVSSFYQEAQKVYSPGRQYILGISKIATKQDGKNFSIELLPEEMIRDYLDQFRPSTIGEQASIA